MKNYVLNYYPNFKCIAKKCKHTCCSGWEMKIDEQSLKLYKEQNSSFFKQRQKGINFKKSKFKIDKKGRCAFLNGEGLCEIIINLGERNLCQVCRDHPRYRSFFDDRIEMGLGFCCEEASRIILSFNDKIHPVLISDDGKKEELSFVQKNVLEFRKKALDIIQDRAINISDRIKNLLKYCSVNFFERDFAKIVKRYLSLERLEKRWTIRLKKIKNINFVKETKEELSFIAEHFLANSLYRHLSDSEDTMSVRARGIACVFSWWIIQSIISVEENDFENVVDIIREYSMEVEYSQKNLEKLFSFAYKFMKI